MTTVHGRLRGDGIRIGIAVSRFNELISERLLAGAQECLRQHGVDDTAIDVVWVPGSFELPLAARELACAGHYAAVLCLGAVIRGATAHFDLVAGQAAAGVARVALDTGVPTIFGVLTTETIEQALERAGTKAGNKGYDAALSALEMADVLRQLRDL